MADLLRHQQTKAFTLPVRVYIEDTDAAGVVFYANYLRFFERARTEFVRSLGFPRVMQFENGISYVVHSLSVQYRKPALLDDELLVTAQVSGLGKTYIQFRQQVVRASSEELLVTADVKVACVDAGSLKPRRIQAALVGAIQTFV